MIGMIGDVSHLILGGGAVLRLLVVLAALLTPGMIFAGDSAAQQEPTDIPVLVNGCIDFSPDACGSPDGDGYSNQLEWITGSDPNDPESTPEYGLLDEQWLTNACGDGIDNDLDGLTDNGDAGCRLTCKDFGPNQRCKESDRDGWLAYLEEMYGSDPSNALSTPESPDVANTCGDGIDNDLDSHTDGADSGCAVPAPCIDFGPDPPSPPCEPF